MGLLKLEWIGIYMEWTDIVFCIKKVLSYWTDLRYSLTYAVAVKPYERWLKLLKIFDLIESIDGWVVGGFRFFGLKLKFIWFYFRLLSCFVFLGCLLWKKN